MKSSKYDNDAAYEHAKEREKWLIEWASKKELDRDTPYKVVNENNHLEVYAIGNSKNKLQNRIDNGYFHRHLPEKLKHIKLIVI